MIVIDVPAAPPSNNPSTSNLESSSSNTRITRSSKSQSPTAIDSHPSLTPGIGQPLVYDIPTDLPIPSFGKQSNDVQRDLARVYEAISNARRIAVICGAGISVSPPANIPDFRSSTGLFKRLKEKHPSAGLTSGKDLFDARLFQSQKTSVLFHAMISELKQLADVAQPTSFHHLLKRLDVEGRLLRVYTQNIDALEERAGLTFGLGETGDRTLTKRNLVGGKRKRNLKGENETEASESGPSNLGNRTSSWGRSQSDSALLFNRKNDHQENGTTNAKIPMFPRVVPLHGSLQTLTCRICAHKMILPDSSKIKDSTIQEEEKDTSKTKLRRRFSTSPNASQRMDIHEDVGDDSEESEMESSFNSQSREVQSVGNEEEDGPSIPTTPEKALELLAKGEPIPCPTCEVANEVRLVGGLRSRGVGLMKVDVVLYGGQNEGAERVGQCLERDVLGLRDPSEPPVPETLRERQTRERKETKDREKFRKEKESKFRMDLGLKEGQQLQVFENEKDALGANFNDFNDGDSNRNNHGFPSGSQPLPNRKNNGSMIGKPKLKPLPPDLLIVAGTSLKVPGTKRIVREFSKACKARDRRIYPDEDEDDESGGDESSTNGSGSKGGSRRSSGRRTETPSSIGEDEEEEEDERDDPNKPIRSILLNYDFPIPAKEWDGVFDFWLRGDLQRAARGLWPDGKPIAARDPFLEAEKLAASNTKFSNGFDKIVEVEEIPTNSASTSNTLMVNEQQFVSENVYNHPQPPLEESWQPLLTGLEEKRLNEKKNSKLLNRSKNSRSQTPSSANLSENDFFNSNHQIGSSPLSSVTSSTNGSSSKQTKETSSGKKSNRKGVGKSKKIGTAQAATIAGANQAVISSKGQGKGKAKTTASSPDESSDTSTSKKTKKSTSSSDATKKALATNKVKKQIKPKASKVSTTSKDKNDEEMVDELLSPPSSSVPLECQSSGIEIIVEEPSKSNKRKSNKKQASLAGSGPFKSVKKGGAKSNASTSAKGK